MYSTVAGRLNTLAMFSKSEELLIASRHLAVSDSVAFPFLSAQIKSYALGGSIREAEGQTGRDGAAIVRANHALFEVAGFANPPISSLCHFSSTTDTINAHLYLHYQDYDPDVAEYPAYRTHRIYTCALRDKESVEGWRTRMRGIYNWAVGTRVASIKEAVQALNDSAGIGPGRDDGSTTVAGSSVPASTATTDSPNPRDTMAQRLRNNEQWPHFTPPMSESETRGDSGAKRQRRI